jgi:anti-sigma factor RsiW
MNCQEFWNSIPEPGDCQDSRHLLECSACAARMSRYRELEAGFRAVAASSRRVEAPPRVEARLRSAFRSQTGRESRVPSRRWIPVATWATAFAAMFAVAALLVRPRPPEVARPPAQHTIELAMLLPQTDADGFVPLPNAAGMAADEDDVNLVRVAVPRSAMIALGFDVSTDRAEELVEADVKLGSNGTARAVRFLD